MTEKEHLERWLEELKDEYQRDSTQLEIYRLNKAGLSVKSRIVRELTYQHSFETEQIKKHLGYDEVTSELAKLNSDEQEQEEIRLQEKIHVLKLAIQRVESYLQQENANTPS